jgi:ubiquinone/menaquinone biosynthesis C-methylase UbiE
MRIHGQICHAIPTYTDWVTQAPGSASQADRTATLSEHGNNMVEEPRPGYQRHNPTQLTTKVTATAARVTKKECDERTGALDDYYREVADKFDAIRLDRKDEIELTIDDIMSFIPRSGLALEVGSGTGRYACAIAKRGVRAIGLDRSYDQLTCGPNSLTRICARGESLPLAPGTFTVCMMILVLHQVPTSRRPQFMAESFRVLRTGGVLAVKTASHQDLQRRPLANFFPSALSVNRSRYPAVEDLIELAELAGYHHIRTHETHSKQFLSTHDLLTAVRLQHNSTLSLIPREEFNAGLNALATALGSSPGMTLDHYHTLVYFRKVHPSQSRRPVSHGE